MRTFPIPIKKFSTWLEGMNTTTVSEEKMYWHVQIFEEEQGFMLGRKEGQPKIQLDEFKI